MTRESDKNALRRITQTLLDPASEPGVLRDATIDAHALLARICGMDVGAPDAEDSRESLLPAGKALSPLEAGRCLLDLARTTKFLRGVRSAIDHAQIRFPGQTIHVLYAGCGPFAPLALLLATDMKPGQVQFTLIDVHPRSLYCVRRSVEALELSPFMHRCVPCDATVYDHGDEPPIHILVIECMQKALAKEPQVAIAMNLVPQMCETGILVPERVVLTVALADVGAEVDGRQVEGAVLDGLAVRKERVTLGPVFELSAESARAFGRESCRDAPDGPIWLPARAIQILPPAYQSQQIAIFTTITVIDSIVLDDYESGLTYPTLVPTRDPAQIPQQLSFAYRLGPTPGLITSNDMP